MHKWTEQDDIVAFYIYKYTDKNLPYSLEIIAKKLGMGIISMKRKLSNFQYLVKGKGLSHYSKQSKKVYEKYKNTPQCELKKIVENYLKEKIK